MSLLTITACVYNGEFIAPKDYVLGCDKINPIGQALIRNFDENACIVVKQVFLIQLKKSLEVIGTTQFKTIDDFFIYKDNQCNKCVEECGIYVNGMAISINGCNIINVV